MNAQQDDRVWDVAVLGGGAAGLSAALTLARARRSVIVIDSGQPRNAPASAAHGLLGQEGVNPLRLLATGRKEVASYGAHIASASVVEASKPAGSAFELRLDDGSTVEAGRLLIATGVRDDLPDIEGLAERWGRDVVHCPYCHGWEIRDRRIGLLATGPMSAMQALLFHQWSEHMWFFLNGIELPADQREKLRSVGIATVPGRMSRVEVREDRLTGVLMDDGTRLELGALAVPALTHARLDGLEGLGVDVVSNAAGVAVVADAAGRTSVPGVWAAGNVVNPGMQVSEAAANGARVAMTINTEMVFAHADQAVAAGAPTAAA